MQMTGNGSLRRLNYQRQASTHFNEPMVGQYCVNFYRHYKKPRKILDNEKVRNSILLFDFKSFI